MALPPHSATMPSRPCLVAANMALSPSLASTRSLAPSGWMKVITGIWSPSGWGDGDGKVFEPAQRVVVTALHWAGDVDFSDLARQRGQHHFALQARDELADTHVDAGAEADMAAGTAGDV